MSARRTALGLAGGFAVLMPLALLVPRGNAPNQPAAIASPSTPLAAPAAAPPLAAAYERSLFGAAEAEEAPLPGDAPALVGVVGRLGADAVALVRTAEGTTRALQIGESVDGWQLASLAIDAAFFTRGAQRVRVPLPAG
jgi:hypothetical protein